MISPSKSEALRWTDLIVCISQEKEKARQSRAMERLNLINDPKCYNILL